MKHPHENFLRASLLGGQSWADTALPTPADNLPILAGIQPAELRRNGATLSLARRAMEHGHLLHSALTRPSMQTHGVLNLDTHLYPSHNLSSVHLATKYVRHSGRTILHASAFSSPTPAPPPRNDTPMKSLGPA